MATYPRDYPTELGPMGLCLRLRRLGERLAQDTRRLYGELGLDIEPGWHAVLQLLSEEEEGLGVSRIGRELGITHPSASSLVKQLIERGYLDDFDDPNDGRRRIVRLSSKARQALPELAKVWSACRAAMQEVIEGTNQDVFGTVSALEEALKQRSMDERAMALLEASSSRQSGQHV